MQYFDDAFTPLKVQTNLKNTVLRKQTFFRHHPCCQKFTLARNTFSGQLFINFLFLVRSDIWTFAKNIQSFNIYNNIYILMGKLKLSLTYVNNTFKDIVKVMNLSCLQMNYDMAIAMKPV